MSKLTAEEVQSIRDEAEKALIEMLGKIAAPEIKSALKHDWLLNNLWRGAIDALTSEREKVKPLLEAAKEVIRCGAVFKENLLSADVTFQEYIDAFEQIETALSNYYNKPMK